MIDLRHGDCRKVLATLADESVDAVVTDPPYELGFMGKAWDGQGIAYDVTMWSEVLRVLKPGGHLLAFGGTRTAHRLTCAIEDAGFEVRDSIAWLYGSGFPKSLDVGKAIDKAAGAEREVVGILKGAATQNAGSLGPFAPIYDATAPATPEAQQWDGWGTALKPAHEPITVARKPFRGTVAANVTTHGTGAINVDACRIGMGEEYDSTKVQRQAASSAGMAALGPSGFASDHEQQTYNTAGRWPANVALDEDMAAVLDEQSGVLTSGKLDPSRITVGAGEGYRHKTHDGPVIPADSGGASRFFYVAKAPTKERPRHDDGTTHPTVKPLTLMRWLVRLVTPPGGTILEPFAGSGTTLEAALLEGFHAIGIEREADYLPLIRQRLARHDDTLFGAAS
jgi:site-specific DNA-methyltransferase (adenine-specific)